MLFRGMICAFISELWRGILLPCFRGLNVFSGLVISEALPTSKPIRQGESTEQ